MDYNTARDVLEKTKTNFAKQSARSVINSIVSACGKDVVLSYLKGEGTFGKILTNGYGEAYLVPEEMVSEFYQIIDSIEICASSKDKDNVIMKFSTLFDRYRLSGGTSSLLIPMEG